MKKICPRCSNSFVCREDRTDLCHCTRVYLTSNMRSYLAQDYEECLCHKCLRETSANFYSFGINPQYKVLKNK